MNASTLYAAVDALQDADQSAKSRGAGAPAQVVFLPDGSISIPDEDGVLLISGGNSTRVEDIDSKAPAARAPSREWDGGPSPGVAPAPDLPHAGIAGAAATIRATVDAIADVRASANANASAAAAAPRLNINADDNITEASVSAGVPILVGAGSLILAPVLGSPQVRAPPPSPHVPAPGPTGEGGQYTVTPVNGSGLPEEDGLPPPPPSPSPPRWWNGMVPQSPPVTDGDDQPNRVVTISLAATLGGVAGLLLAGSIPLAMFLVRRHRARRAARLREAGGAGDYSGSDLEAGLAGRGSGGPSSTGSRGPLLKPGPRGGGGGLTSSRPDSGRASDTLGSTGILSLLPSLGRGRSSQLQFIMAGRAGTAAAAAATAAATAAGESAPRGASSGSSTVAPISSVSPTLPGLRPLPTTGMLGASSVNEVGVTTDGSPPPAPLAPLPPDAFAANEVTSGGDLGTPTAQTASLMGDSEAVPPTSPAAQLWSVAGASLPPWSDGRVSPEEITIALRPDGSPWLLGTGAYGRVYRALRDGVQPVAVKVLAGMDNARRRDEFIREVTLLRSCRDRNIVQFVGACIQGEEAMLVTEFMEFGDLWRAATLRNTRGARIFGWWGRGGRVALDVARGLHFLHSRSIVHLDLKSANILLARDGSAKIADVGFARVMTRSYMLSGGGGAGTFAWSAPEVLFGHRCGPRSDIYSFGVVLWELCTGETPLRGDMRPLRVPEEAPQGVADLIRRCMDTDPGKRPDTRALVHALEALLREAPPADLASAARQGAAVVCSSSAGKGTTPSGQTPGDSSSLDACTSASVPDGGGASTDGDNPSISSSQHLDPGERASLQDGNHEVASGAETPAQESRAVDFVTPAVGQTTSVPIARGPEHRGGQT